MGDRLARVGLVRSLMSGRCGAFLSSYQLYHFVSLYLYRSVAADHQVKGGDLRHEPAAGPKHPKVLTISGTAALNLFPTLISQPPANQTYAVIT